MKKLLLFGLFSAEDEAAGVITEFVVFAVELLVVEPVELFVNKKATKDPRLAREAEESVNVFTFMTEFLSAIIYRSIL